MRHLLSLVPTLAICLSVEIGCSSRFSTNNENNDPIGNNTDSSRQIKIKSSISRIPLDSTIPCDSMLVLFVKSSDLDSNLKKYNINAQEMDDGVLTISITNLNELDHKTPIAWLELDTSKKELKDVTIDPDHPKILIFDETVK